MIHSTQTRFISIFIFIFFYLLLFSFLFFFLLFCFVLFYLALLIPSLQLCGSMYYHKWIVSSRYASCFPSSAHSSSTPFSLSSLLLCLFVYFIHLLLSANWRRRRRSHVLETCATLVLSVLVPALRLFSCFLYFFISLFLYFFFFLFFHSNSNNRNYISITHVYNQVNSARGSTINYIQASAGQLPSSPIPLPLVSSPHATLSVSLHYRCKKYRNEDILHIIWC